jgi:hypothetical protein
MVVDTENGDHLLMTPMPDRQLPHDGSKSVPLCHMSQTLKRLFNAYSNGTQFIRAERVIFGQGACFVVEPTCVVPSSPKFPKIFFVVQAGRGRLNHPS